MVLVVETVVELVTIEVDVVVIVVERLVVDVGEKVVVVDRGGVLTLASPKIPFTEELDTASAPTSERRSTRPSRVMLREFMQTTSATEQVPTITTFRACRAHQLSLVG